MPLPRQQRTLAQSATVSGRGYWTGREATVEFRPAPPDAGLTFVRDDVPGRPRITVASANQQPTAWRTVLSAGDATVELVEHALAALIGLGVDNCEIGVDTQELPGCDGSSLVYSEAIVDAGLVVQAEPAAPLVVTQPVRHGGGDCWIELRPPIGDGLSVEYNLDYGPQSSISPQWFVAHVTPANFHAELAPARTFLLESEAAAIQAQGLARHVTPQDLLVFGPNGPIDNTLRFPDECARHKALDIVGDLALAGRPIVGHVVACRTGHRDNAELVRALLALPSSNRRPDADDAPPSRRSA